jgi:ElaB/YqjD/DUF883 family membrane-anchored ribosome-binding protein
MIPSNSHDSMNRPADAVADAAEQALAATRRVANEMLDSVGNSVEGVRQQAVPMLNRASDQAIAMAQHGVDAVRDTSRQWREQAQHASDRTVTYIREEPVKAMLIAATAGALLVALAGLVRRARHAD